MFHAYFLFPGFLAGALALAVPLVLHLLRRRRGQPVPLPSLFFLKPVVRSARFHAWRRWLVLFMRCAALLALAFAFARPYLEQGRTIGQATIVLVDQSFSMQTADRWTSLQAWVKEQIGTPEDGDMLALLAMSNHPSWLQPMTSDHVAVLRELQGLKPGWETARVEPGLRLAGETLAANPAKVKRIICLMDHQQLSWAGTDFSHQLPAGVNLVFAPPSPFPANQAALSIPSVTRLAAGGLVAEVKVRCYSSTAQTRLLRAYLENDLMPTARVTLSLAPQEEKVVRLELPSDKKPHWLRLSLDPDDLPADDTVYVVVSDETKGGRTVYLDAREETTGFDFVATALATVANIPPHIHPEPMPRGNWPRGSVALLRSEKSFTDGGAKLDAFLNADGQAIVLVNDKIAASAWWTKHGITPTPLVSRTEPWRVHDWTLEHPVVSPLAEYGLRGLLGWEFRTGWSFARSALEPIGLWDNDTVAVGELRLGAGRLFVCGFAADRRANDWPIDEEFVPFLHRAVAELLDSTQHGALLPANRVGEPVPLPAGSGQWRAVAGPATDIPPVLAEGAVIPKAPGVYAFTHGAETALFAVNVPAEESDLAPWPEGRPWKQLEHVASPRDPTTSAMPIPLAALEAEEKSGRWWWCVAILLVFLFTEMAVGNRTTR